MPLFGSKCVPLHRRLIVLWNTFSVGVHYTQIVLGIGIPLDPADESGDVLR